MSPSWNKVIIIIIIIIIEHQDDHTIGNEIAAMLVFKLSCKLATCYARGQTLETRQIAEDRLVEILK